MAESAAPALAAFTPIEPMLAKLVDDLPPAGAYLFEPKWDGFRALVFRPRPGEIAIQSRDLRPLDRYFPELRGALVDLLPDGSIVDGEIVVVGADGLDFDALQQRLHPAEVARQQAGAGDAGRRSSPSTFSRPTARALSTRRSKSAAPPSRRCSRGRGRRFT